MSYYLTIFRYLSIEIIVTYSAICYNDLVGGIL